VAQKFLFINYSLNNKYNNFNRLVSLSSGVVSDKAPFYYLCVSSSLLGGQWVKGLRRFSWPVERGCGSGTLLIFAVGASVRPYLITWGRFLCAPPDRDILLTRYHQPGFTAYTR